MKEYQLEKIKFISYIKLISISGLGMGIILGMIGFIISLFDGDAVYVTIGSETTTGIIAGVSMLIMSPFLMTFLFCFFSIFLYLGFKLIIKLKKSIKLTIQITENKK